MRRTLPVQRRLVLLVPSGQAGRGRPRDARCPVRGLPVPCVSRSRREGRRRGAPLRARRQPARSLSPGPAARQTGSSRARAGEPSGRLGAVLPATGNAAVGGGIAAIDWGEPSSPRPIHAPVAQGIEHPPPKRGAASSILAGRATSLTASLDHRSNGVLNRRTAALRTGENRV